MDNIILCLALFTATATAVQVSLFRRWWQQLGLALVIAAITYGFYPRAIRLSTVDMENLLADPAAMLDMSVVLILEAAVMLMLALFMLRDMYTQLHGPWKWFQLLQYLPTASAVGVLCFFQVHLYQQGIELDFERTALLYGGGVALTIVIFAAVIKFTIPLRVLRLELKLAMHAAQIILAIATSVLMATYPYRDSAIETNLPALGAVTLLTCVGITCGYWRQRKQLQKLAEEI